MTTAVAPSTRLPTGETVPVLGMGTWHLAEDPRRRKTEMTALQLGIDLGMCLIDTAEMYGNGAAEQLVGEAIAGRRDELRGLKENVILGHIIPAGTGFRDFMMGMIKRDAPPGRSATS